MKQIKIFKPNNNFLLNKKSYLNDLNKFFLSGNYILGKNVTEIESELSNFVKSNCLTVANGTDALEIILRGLGIKKNDEVIVPVFTWISTASAVKIVDAKPIFSDIELDTYGLCYNSVKKLINKNTKAIIIVSLYGQISKDIFRIKKLCKKKKIFLIEDAAQSFGSILNNNISCSIGDFSTTSFFPTKSLGGYGDGGAIFTKKKNFFTKFKTIRQNGSIDKKNFTILGRNSRMDEIQALLIRKKLKKFKQMLKRKRQTANNYIKNLKNNFKFAKFDKNYPSYSLFTLRHKKRDQLVNFLNTKNIYPGVYYKYLLSDIKFFNYKKKKFPNARLMSKQCFSIPIHEGIDINDQKKIISQINFFLKNYT